MNENLFEFLISLGVKSEIVSEQFGKAAIDQRFYKEYEQPSYEFGSLRFIPQVDGSGGSGATRIPVRLEDGMTYIDQKETQGGGRLGGVIAPLENAIIDGRIQKSPSGVSFGGGVSGSYYRGKQSFPRQLQSFGAPESVTYGPSGMVNSYDAFVNLPSGVNISGAYQPETDDYNIMARIRKEF